MIVPGEIDTKNATAPPLGTEMNGCNYTFRTVNSHKMPRMLRYWTSGWAMSGGFRDARMLHVFYGPRTTTMLCERVD